MTKKMTTGGCLHSNIPNGSNSLSIDEISQDRNDLFSAIVSAKDGVIEDIRSLPGVLQNFAPLLQGLGNFN